MNSYSAGSTFDEAFDRTVSLLWPPHSGVWIRIALIALFLGGGMANPIRTEDIRISEQGVSGLSGQSAFIPYMNTVLTIGAGILAIFLIYVIISSVLQFVFVDCLSSGKILLGRTFRSRWRKGVQLMGFYLVLLAIIIITGFVTSFLIIIPLFQSGIPDMVTLLISTVKTLILILIILIPVWIIAILTADFIVPIMIADNSGLCQAGRTFFVLFTGRWREAGIYTGLKILSYVITGIVLGVILYLVSIPLGTLQVVLPHGKEIVPQLTSEILIRIGTETAAMVLISLLFLVPVITFFRYYSLAILRDVHPGYNLLPDFGS